MRRKQAKSDNADIQRITELVATLNRYRHEYYNLAKSRVSDAVYDRLFDELAALERKTGIILSNFPTQTVGYTPVSALRKVRHTVPLLSMDKTKQINDLVSMVAVAPALLMLKLDGLTVKLRYENGEVNNIIWGTFFLCGAPADGEDFVGLTPEQAEQLEKQFHTPEAFVGSNGRILCVPFPAGTFM